MDDQASRSGGVCLEPPLDLILESAIARHGEGQIVEASTLYEIVLAGDETNVDAMHLLGVLHIERGDPARALGYLDRAVELRPDIAEFHDRRAESCFALGRHEEAASSARAALRLGGEEASARYTLGLALQGMGRNGEAAEEYRRVVGLSPEVAAAHFNLGNVSLSLGRVDEARAAFLEAIRLAPDLAAPYVCLGIAFLKEDRYREAGPWLCRAVELDPSRPNYWQLLAEVHGRLESYGPAILCWERVIGLTPDDRARPRLALGWALQEENRLDEAEAQYRAAAAIEPTWPEPHVDLGGLHEERGEFAQAEASLREALRLAPTFSLSHARLALLLGNKLPDADLGAISGRLEDPSAPASDRIPLLFAMAHVLDARGDHARAASRSREANALSIATAPADRRFEPAVYERFIVDIIRAFGRDFFAKAAGAGLETRRPVFIVGLPRSGTTLIEQVLASHPAVHGAGELRLAFRMFESLPMMFGSSGCPTECIPHLDPATIRGLAEAYDRNLRAVTGDLGERVVDKLPENYLYLGMLAAIYPNATIIHCRRDLRDVALSCWMLQFRSMVWTNDPTHIAVKFRAYRTLMDHWRDVLPTTIHEVDYEETVSDLEGVARRLLAAVGLDWDPACLEFHRTTRAVRTSSAVQVRQPLYKRAVGRWKSYEHELADLFASLPPDSRRPA